MPPGYLFPSPEFETPKSRPEIPHHPVIYSIPTKEELQPERITQTKHPGYPDPAQQKTKRSLSFISAVLPVLLIIVICIAIFFKQGSETQRVIETTTVTTGPPAARPPAFTTKNEPTPTTVIPSPGKKTSTAVQPRDPAIEEIQKGMSQSLVASKWASPSSVNTVLRRVRMEEISEEKWTYRNGVMIIFADRKVVRVQYREEE